MSTNECILFRPVEIHVVHFGMQLLMVIIIVTIINLSFLCIIDLQRVLVIGQLMVVSLITLLV